MHPLNDACFDTLPVFDETPQPVWMEYKAYTVVRRYRIAPAEESKKALCSSIHLQRVPISVHDEYGIRLMLRHEKLHGAVRRL